MKFMPAGAAAAFDLICPKVRDDVGRLRHLLHGIIHREAGGRQYRAVSALMGLLKLPLSLTCFMDAAEQLPGSLFLSPEWSLGRGRPWQSLAVAAAVASAHPATGPLGWGLVFSMSVSGPQLRWEVGFYFPPAILCPVPPGVAVILSAHVPCWWFLSRSPPTHLPGRGARQTRCVSAPPPPSSLFHWTESFLSSSLSPSHLCSPRTQLASFGLFFPGSFQMVEWWETAWYRCNWHRL